jgi:hypothetical protein
MLLFQQKIRSQFTFTASAGQIDGQDEGATGQNGGGGSHHH